MLGILLNELDSRLKEEIGAITFCDLASTITPQDRSVIRGISVWNLTNAARTMDKNVLKSLVLRSRWRVVPEMPLTRNSRTVSVRLTLLQWSLHRQKCGLRLET